MARTESRKSANFRTERAETTVERAAVACLRTDVYTTLGQTDRAVAVNLIEAGLYLDNLRKLIPGADKGRAPARSASAHPMVMSGLPASDGRCTRARPASHVWNASVDVLRRTRRNAYPISGAAPEVNHRTSCRGSRGSASQRLI